MAVENKLYTADELWELSKLPSYADKRLELLEGELIEMAPSSALPAIIASRLDRRIGTFVEQHNLGYTTTAEGGFELSPKNVLAPDIGFMPKERVAAVPERYFQGAPDLAVEVKSPTDRKRTMRRKAEKYIEAGTRLVWLVFPDEHLVEVYAPDEDVLTIGLDGALDGGNVLPGFKLAVKDIFGT